MVSFLAAWNRFAVQNWPKDQQIGKIWPLDWWCHIYDVILCMARLGTHNGICSIQSVFSSVGMFTR